jgi:hypothetical protein
MTISLPDDLRIAIGRVAMERDMSTSALCRLLFREEIERHERTKSDSKSGNWRTS